MHPSTRVYLALILLGLAVPWLCVLVGSRW